MVHITCAAATPAQAAVLDRVGEPDMSEQTIAAVQQVIIDTGALAELEGHIRTLTDEALASLATMPLAVGARDELAALAHYVSWRDI